MNADNLIIPILRCGGHECLGRKIHHRTDTVLQYGLRGAHGMRCNIQSDFFSVFSHLLPPSIR